MNACVPGAKPRAVSRFSLRCSRWSIVPSPSPRSSHRMIASSPDCSSGRGETFHSCSNTVGGLQVRIRPVTCNRDGPAMKSMVPPSRPSITALVMYHLDSSEESVRAFPTTSGEEASRLRNTRVALVPSITTAPVGPNSSLLVTASSPPFRLDAYSKTPAALTRIRGKTKPRRLLREACLA